MDLAQTRSAWRPPRPEARCIASARPGPPRQSCAGFAPASVTRRSQPLSSKRPSPAATCRRN